MPDFRRREYVTLLSRLAEPRRFMQVLCGPRQVGKTTLARQVLHDVSMPGHYATADEPALKGRDWIEQQWEVGRARARGAGGEPDPALLVLDEIQKIPGWSETVKRLWDEDTASETPLVALLLGSSALNVRAGLGESLAGRYEVVPLTHWSFGEMRDAFGIDLEAYLRFGSYPGAVALTDEPERWRRYILEALVEPVISRDILLTTRVDKPALLRRLFELGCAWSGRVLSYQKMVGQLQDAGNTTTLAHYLDLLGGAGLLTGLQKYSGRRVRRRASSPKLLALNTALMTAVGGPVEHGPSIGDDQWGHLVETAVGAHLRNDARGSPDIELFYWSSGNRELDYVLRRDETVVAIEVKGGPGRRSRPGMAAFCREHRVTRKLLVGADGIPLEEFLLTPVRTWLDG